MADTVLVTGISGFLGGHVALALLKAGYRVRGSMRDPGRAEKIRAALARAGADVTQLDFVTLDLLDDAGWSKAMASVRYLQHTASPFLARTPRDQDELVRPAVEGTERAVRAALAAGVERIVLTSSMAAIAYGHGRAHGDTFTAADWTNVDGPGVSAYTRSKTLAERRAWELMRERGRERDLVAVNPGAILGPLLDEDPGTSVALVGRLLAGAVPAAPRLSFGIVDVRDVADLHVATMLAPATGGQRLPFDSAPIALIEAARILAAAFPERAGRLPRFVLPDWTVRIAALFNADIRDNLGELGRARRVDASAAIALLGRDPITPAEALIASARSLIATGLVK
jgi:nucleoside-diphosphate-sugar epimerase